MKNTTRVAYNGYTARLATLNDVAGGTVSATFSVDPSVQQTLEEKMQESSEFLKSINIVGRDEQEGEKIGLGVSGPVASRTDTSGDKRRRTRDASAMSNNKYRCEKTNFDTHITYTKLDAWAKFPDFQTRLASAILKRQALDRIMIGFNGVKVSADTNLAQYPLLQDVNKGWLQHMREDSPQRVLGLVGDGLPGKVVIGKGNGADYKTLDAAVYDAVTNLDPWYQDDTGLVVIVGRELLHDKYFPMINSDQAPTEALAADIIVGQKRIGGLPAVRVPSFPPNAMLITRLDNLSIYYQNGGRRRRVVDAADADRVENYESSNDAYVIEDDGLAALVENVVLQDAAGGA